MTKQRSVISKLKGIIASDGDGVKLTRLIGSPDLNHLDPFLLFDAFGSDQPRDYIGGFPPHPHRGFETVSYMLEGKMKHQDSQGNSGVISAGGVQWMTAGKGIIHSEMPEQEHGRLAGFQLWVNLPAEHKMTPPKYQEHDAYKIPVEQTNENIQIKVIAGKTKKGTQGIIKNDLISPTYFDIQQTQQSAFSQNINVTHNAFVYIIDGEIEINGTQINSGEIGVLSHGDEIIINAKTPARYLLIAGQPLNEPIARGGPFVMNTKAEIEQAFSDYRLGRLA